MTRVLILLLCTVLTLSAACARDREAVLRARLERWFVIDEGVYFRSRARCTAAVYRLKDSRPTAALRVDTNPVAAKTSLALNGHAALRMEGFSPNDLTDELLLSGDGTFGKQALHAGALAGPCFEDDQMRRALFDALTRSGATLAYDGASAGVMLLDEAQMRLFYIAGDVW